MSGISRYEKFVLFLTLGFVLLSGGHFMLQRHNMPPIQVAVSKTVAIAVAPDSDEGYPDSLLEGEMINLNTADSYDLQRLPRIGPAKAQNIIDYRRKHGAFQRLEQLLDVPGIGPFTLEGFQEYVTVENW